MKTYELYIKSHCEYPDWEEEGKFESREEAARLWARNTDWHWEDLVQHIHEV